MRLRLARTLAILGLSMLLFACAPKLQPLGPTVTAPAIGDAGLVMDDGVALPLRHWPAVGEPKAAILAIHGFNDYSQAFEQPAAQWAKLGIETYAYDQRGFGRTAYHGLWAGDERMLKDLQEAARLIAVRNPGLPFYILGESMGGAVVMSAAVDGDPPRADGFILVAPAIWGRQSMGPVASGALWFFAHTIPWYTVTGQGLHIQPSDNRAMLEKLFRDPLVIKATRIDTVYGLVGLMDRAWAAAPRLPARVLVLYGEHEQVLDDDAVVAMLHRLPRGPAAPSVALYAHGYHMLLRDLNGEVVNRDIADWILHPGAPLPSGADTLAQKLLAGPKAGLAAAK
jgi:alpha-beta hydrolase superfamily lysophospholipase